MGFDVFGPTGHVVASNVDDGVASPFDLLALPGELGLQCPLLERLNQRFYESTTVFFVTGQVHALRDELVQIQQAYRERRGPELIKQRHVHSTSPEIQRGILDRILQNDDVFHALDEFRLLCEEAIAAETDVQCEGD